MDKKCKTCSKIYNKGGYKFCSTGCKTRAGNIKQRYGITADFVKALYKSQQGMCAICDIPVDVYELGFTKSERGHIDHQHSTGHVRGLLCGECNLGLGKFKDNRNTLKRAISYLTKTYKKE